MGVWASLWPSMRVVLRVQFHAPSVMKMTTECLTRLTSLSHNRRMRSMRDLVSGRDFQLRYALHRLTLLALGADPLHERAARLRLEWPLSVEGGEVWVDV